MKGGENMGPIPTDLVIEIFLRLPSKSIARFRSLSKLWAWELRRPYFTELFLTRSRARPRLLLAVEQSDVWSLYSLPQPHNPYVKSSLVAMADFHIKFPGKMREHTCRYASGLIDICPSRWISSTRSLGVICNPITGQSGNLPELRTDHVLRRLLGFDPIDKQYKVLAISHPYRGGRKDIRILTLETGNIKWRKIQCPFTYELLSNKAICINGVLYYLVYSYFSAAIVCFDVRSENFFKVINRKSFDSGTSKLINYKGKLGGIDCKHDDDGRVLELRLCVLEDVQKQDWSEHVYTLPETNAKVANLSDLYVAGVTATGEIVLSMEFTCTSQPFYVFYFSPEKNTLQAVQIQGFGANLEPLENPSTVYAFVDHVEDLNLNDATLLKSSISASSMKS